MKIIYPTLSGIAVIFPTGELPIEEVARKDVPAGVPYLFVEDDDILTGVPQEAWVADFSNPDGYGIGAKAWFEEQKAKRTADEAVALRALHDKGSENSHGEDQNQQG